MQRWNECRRESALILVFGIPFKKWYIKGGFEVNLLDIYNKCLIDQTTCSAINVRVSIRCNYVCDLEICAFGNWFCGIKKKEKYAPLHTEISTEVVSHLIHPYT